MTAREAKQRLERIWKAYTSAYDSISEDDVTAFDMAISALQAQKSKTKENCDTCKHDPPSKKWPCVDCDMRAPADRWEAQDVPDTNVGDMISRLAAIDEILRITTFTNVRELYEYVQKHNLTEMWCGGINDAIDAVIAVPSAQPEQNAYEQGRITGRVEMRTEILSALKNMVGSEVWNNV